MHPRFRLFGSVAILALFASCGDDSSTAPAEQIPVAKGMHGITITAPNGGETFKAGDSISVKWTSDLDSMNDAEITIFCGSATTETALYPNSVTSDMSSWGNLRVRIPASLSGSCKIRIRDYQVKSNFDTTDSRFTVNAR